MAQEINVLTEQGLRQYTETLVQWIKSKLDVKAEEALNLKLTAEGNDVKLSLFSGNTLLNRITIPIVGENAGLITPTMAQQIGNGGGEGISIQSLIDGTNIAFAAMEVGYIYIKNGCIYMPMHNSTGGIYDIIKFNNTGIKRISNNGEFELYPSYDDIYSIDEELDEESENPLQNKVIANLFDNLESQLNELSQSIPNTQYIENQIETTNSEVSGLRTWVTRIDNEKITGLQQEISNLYNSLSNITDNILDENIAELEEKINQLKGQAIVVDNSTYSFEQGTLYKLNPRTELTTGTYLIDINGTYYIYDAVNKSKFEIPTIQQILDNTGKVIPLSFYGNLTQEVLDAAEEGDFIFDTNNNKLYKKSNNEVSIVNGESFILSNNNVFYTYKSGTPQIIWTSLNGNFISRNDVISRIGSIIPIAIWTDSVEDSRVNNLGENEYLFTISDNMLWYKYNGQIISVTNQSGKYLISYENEYYIVDVGHSCNRITLDSIENIYIKTSENEIIPLSRNNSENENSVTIDLSNVSTASSNNSGISKIIEVSYWEDSNLMNEPASPGTYGTDSNDVLYMYNSSQWEQVGAGNFLISYQDNNQNYNLYFLSMSGSTITSGNCIRLASYGDIATTSGAVTGIKLNGASVPKNSDGTVNLLNLVNMSQMTGILNNYYQKDYINNNFASKSYVDSKFWTKLVKVDEVTSENITIESNVYGFNTLDSSHKLIINNNKLLLKVVDRDNIIHYYSKWTAIPNIASSYSDYGTNDLFYNIKTIDNESTLCFWRYTRGVYEKILDISDYTDQLNTQINNTVSQSISDYISDTNLSINDLKLSKKVVCPVAIIQGTSINLTNNSFYIVNDVGQTEVNSNSELIFVNNEGATFDVTEDTLVIYDEKLYLYCNKNNSYQFIEINSSSENTVVSSESNLIIVRYWQSGNPDGMIEDDYWYNITTTELSQYKNGSWTTVNKKSNALYFASEINCLYKWDETESQFVIVTASNDGITDAELNVILKEVADLVEEQAKRIRDFNLNISSISTINSNLNELRGYKFGFDNNGIVNSEPETGNVGDILVLEKNGSKDIIKCTDSAKYPVIVIRCRATDTSSFTSESYIFNSIPIVAYNNFVESVNNITIPKGLTAEQVAEHLCNQISEKGGYIKLDIDYEEAKNNVIQSQKGSVCIFTYSGYYYVKIVPKNYGTAICDSVNQSLWTQYFGGAVSGGGAYKIKQNPSQSDAQIPVILTYVYHYDNNIYQYAYTKGTNAVWTPINNLAPNKLVLSQNPYNYDKPVINGQQCLWYDGEKAKPYWYYNSSWYDAQGNYLSRNATKN